MALEELDGLFNDIAEGDRATIKAILERNANAAQRLTQRETVYTAFVDGDTTRLAALTTPATTTTTVTSPASVDLADLDRRLDERVDKIFADPRFNTAVEARAKTLADAAIAAATDGIVGRALKGGAEITTILHNHRTQYGKELDQPAYEKFVTDNAGKFVSLSAAYEAFTENERIQKKIDDGVRAGLAAQQTANVPGVSQPGAGTPAGMMIKANPMNTGVAAQRGDAIDAAAAAFRQLSNARVN